MMTSLHNLYKSEYVIQHSVPLHEQNGERESTNESTAESESDRSDSECSTTSETRLVTPVQGDPSLWTMITLVHWRKSNVVWGASRAPLLVKGLAPQTKSNAQQRCLLVWQFRNSQAFYQTAFRCARILSDLSNCMSRHLDLVWDGVHWYCTPVPLVLQTCTPGLHSL